jgi:hypothetical protein
VASRAAEDAAPEAAQALSATAERLRGDIGGVADRVSERLLGEIGDLGDEPELAAELSATVRASVLAWLDFLSLGRPTREVALPADAIALARTYALRGVDGAAT